MLQSVKFFLYVVKNLVINIRSFLSFSKILQHITSDTHTV